MIKRFLRSLSLAAMALAVTLPAGASDHTLSNYAYRVPVCATNSTGGALTNAPVAFTANPAALVDGGFLQNDAGDLRPANGAGVSVPAMAQDIADSSSTWWLSIDSLPNGQERCWYLHMGNATATRDHGIVLHGADDSVTVADAASLDITTNLTLESLGTTLSTIPSGEAFLIGKDGAYQLGVRDTDTVFARLTQAATSAILRPDGAGDFTNLTANGAGCTGIGNWACVDEAVADDFTTSVSTTSTNQQDAYTLGAFAPTSVTITSVQVTARHFCNNTANSGSVAVGLRLAGTTELNAEVTSTNAWTNTTEMVARPGGGSWAVSDVANLQVVIDLDDDACSSAQVVTQVYVTVHYLPEFEVTYSPIVVNNEYDFKATYDGAALNLYVDDVEEDSTAVSGAILTNANAVTISDIDGTISQTRIGGTSVATPTYVLDLQYEPSHMAQTQEGEGGNGWEWTGTIADQSASNNDAAYIFMRDMTGIAIAVRALESKAALPAVLVDIELKDILGGVPDLLDRGTPASNIPGYAIVVALAAGVGTTTEVAFLVAMLLIGTVAGGLTAIGTKLPAFGLVVIGGFAIVGGPLGMYDYWVAMAVGFMLFGMGGAMALVGRR